MKILVFLFILNIGVIQNCNAPKNLTTKLSVSKIYDMEIVPKNGYSYNNDWIIKYGDLKFQVKRISIFNKQHNLDSLYLVKTESVMSYGIADLKRDTSLFRYLDIEDLSDFHIYNNIIFTRTDTFSIHNLTNKRYLVQNRSKLKHYRLYILK